MQRTPLPWRTLLLSTLGLIFFAQSALAAPPAKFRWSNDRLEVAVPAGGQLTEQLTLTADRNASDIRFEAVPSIQELLTISPSALPTVRAGEELPIQITFRPREDMPQGRYQGTVHIRSGNATRPAVLKVAITVTEAEETYMSPAVVTLDGASPTSFNSLSSTLSYDLSGASFGGKPQLYHQGKPVPAEKLTVSAERISVEPLLQVGRNDIILVATDAEGRGIFAQHVLWAGNRTLYGTVENEAGGLIAEAAVTVLLGDDQAVRSTVTAVNGQFSVTNLPPRTVLIEGTADGDLRGSTAANGGEGATKLTLVSFHAPSPIDNNDFSQGLDGWDLGNAPVYLVPHEPEAATALGTFSASTLSTPKAGGSRAERHAAVGDASAIAPMSAFGLSASASNMDLRLGTLGMGPRRISRTFNTKIGTRSVKVRYRFHTTEIPGGYYGTQFNDYYNVSVRSGSGGAISESNSMNGLGLGAFDPAGRTAWREKTLQVNPEGDTVQVEATVANVADGLLDSYVYIDLIEEGTLTIAAMDLRDIDDTDLNYLSAAAHTYFGGQTRIHGTVTVEGAEDDTLESLVLEIIQSGSVVATAELASDAGSSLLQTFGEDGKVQIAASKLLFELAPSGIDVSTNSTVSFRARARSSNGEEATLDVGSAEILTRHLGSNRYGNGRDEAVGGDDWVKPSVDVVATSYGSNIYGDFSNMNGGQFKPHGSHQTGNDVDGWYTGYNARDAATAQTMIDLLNESNGSRITTVYVTFKEAAGDAFYDAIKDVTLTDGRKAIEVIRPWKGHETHFHWLISDQ